MACLRVYILIMLSVCSVLSLSAQNPETKVHLAEKPVAMTSVKNIGGFFGERLNLNRKNYLKKFPIDRYVEFIEKRKHTEWDWKQAEQHGKWIESAYLSAIQSGDRELLNEVNSVLRRIMASQEEDGYVGATARSYRTVERPLRGMDAYELYFVFHAFMTVYEETGNKNVLCAAEKLADYILKYIGPGKAEFWPTDLRYPENIKQQVKSKHSLLAGHSVHYSWEGTLLADPVLRLYQNTGKKEYLEWGKWVIANIDKWSGWNAFSNLDLVAEEKMGVHELQPYVHSHTFHMNFMGFLRLYCITGDRSLLNKVIGAWEDIVKRQMYITGGVSVGEHYEHGYVKPITGNVVETCATMSWMQLTQFLLELTGESKYADAMERLMFNHVFAAQTCDGDGLRYHTAPNGVKPTGYFRNPDCCTASGHRMISLLPVFFYAVDSKGVFVNQYISSEYVSDGLGLKVETNYPQEELIRINVLAAEKEKKIVRLRIPGWCKAPEIKLNGKVQKGVKTGDYFSLTRKWKRGDVIELTFPMELQWMKRAHHAEYSFTRLPGGEPMYTEIATTHVPYALTRGPVTYMLDMVWNDFPDGKGNTDIAKDIRVDMNVKPLRKSMDDSAILGPGYLVNGLYKGEETKLLMIPFANVGKWYKGNKEPDSKKNEAAYSYAIWLYRAPVHPAVAKRFQSFGLDEVTLKDKEWKFRQDHDLAYIRTLEPDRYLSPFRRNAGIEVDSKGNPVDNTKHYSGWETLGSSTFGHYLSALSMMYKVTGDTTLLHKINYIIDELDFIQRNPGYENESLRNGALVAFDRDRRDHVREPNFLRTYDELRQGKVNLTFAPDNRGATVENAYFKTFYWLSGGLAWYTNHKIYAGIRDAYLYAGNPKAKKVFLYFCDWACWATGKLDENSFARMLYSEHGAMNEMLTDAYILSGDQKYLDCAFRFNEQETIAPCMTGDTKGIAKAISHTHANAQIPQFYGLLKEFEYTGDDRLKNATKNFFQYVTNYQSFATGGNSEWEQFRSAGNINAQITRRSGETCNTYNMLKIAKGLFEFTGDTLYPDYMERALYNHILPSIHTGQLGAFTYFLSLEPGYFKTFSRPYDSHWCCVGTGMENHAKYGEFIYFHQEKEVYVNLWVASTLSWKDKGFQMETVTDFPYGSKVRFMIQQNEGKISALNLRIPRWTDAMEVKVNGNTLKSENRNGYLRLERFWKAGDVIELVVPMHLRKEYVPDSPDKFAFFYGPVLLAGKLGKSGMPDQVFARGENDFTHTDQYDYKGNMPCFSKGFPADVCLKAVEKDKLSFISEEGIEFVPLYQIMEERYSVYWQEK